MRPSSLSHLEQKALLTVARGSIAEALGVGARPTVEAGGALGRPRGAFVTLHTQGGDLRGCVGTFQPRGTLLDTVAEMARAAAFDDPRFPPVRAEELETLEVEISALSELAPGAPGAVEVGIHGLCVQRGFHRGVLLPQVAVEERWDRETFLDHTCLKAGLPPGAWRQPDTKLFTFTAEVFGEKERMRH